MSDPAPPLSIPVGLPPTSKAAETEYLRDNKAHRNMAWVSLISIILVTLLLMFVVTPDRLKAIEYIVTWFFTILGGIVLTELGVSGFFTYFKR